MVSAVVGFGVLVEGVQALVIVIVVIKIIKLMVILFIMGVFFTEVIYALCPLDQGFFQSYFIPQGDIIIANLWDGWFKLSRDIHLAWGKGGQVKAASLIKSQSMQVVIGGDQAKCMTVGLSGDVFQGGYQRGSNALVFLQAS
jgi:hypothetical protein